MSKRYLKIALLLLLTLSVTFIFVACLGTSNSSDNGKNNTSDEKVIESIQIDRSSIPDTLYAGRVRLSEISLIVKYSDGTQTSVQMSEDYIAVGSRNKLKEIGTKQIDVVYGNCTTSFQIDLLDPTVAVFTLTVEGGVPVSVNGNVPGSTQLTNGVYVAEFTGGTVVVIEWIAENDKTFGYWEADGVSVDNQSTTTVYMDADHVYHAVAFDIVYNVNFITYKDNYNIASKEIKRLYDNSAEYDKNNIYYDVVPSVAMDDYVFAGWTAETISRDRALSGSDTITLINFDSVDETGAKYVRVDRNITLYAVWTPIKLSFTSHTPSVSGYTQTTGYQTVRYEGTLTDLVIPDTYDGMPVLSISRDTFTGQNAAFIETITIPATVVEIEEGTFKNCSSLRAIYVAQGSPIYTGENGVLYKDERATLVAYPANKVVRTYEMESNVSTIASYAFYNAVVGQIVVSPDVASLGDHAFDSVHIDAIDFSNVAVGKLSSVKSHIGDQVFNSQLSSIILTSAQEDWDDFAALHCFDDYADRFSNGTDVHRINTYIYSDNVVILFRIINGNDLAPYFKNTGSTAEIIGISRHLKEIIVPDRLLAWNTSYAVSSIGYYAFKDCRSLTAVTLPTDLERVCDKAFDDTPWAENLTASSIIANDILYKYLGHDSTYNLPSNVKRIAESAFRDNKSLEFFNISSNSVLEDVSALAFYGCENLTSFSETNNDKTLLIKRSLLSVGAFSFSDTAIRYIVSEEGSNLASVGEYAFAECKYLLTIGFGSAVLSDIDDTAFLNTESLLSYEVTDKNDFYATYHGVLYKMTGNTTAALFAYPSGKISDVFDPAVFTKKYVEIRGDVFSVFGREYTVTEVDTDRVVGQHTETVGDVETTTSLTLSKDGGGAYVNVQVNLIGANSLHNSNIGALVISESIRSSEPIMIPGIAYVSILSLSSLSYSNLFPSKEYEPRFVCFPTLVKENTLGFFNSSQALCDEKYVSAAPIEFFTYDDNLYYYDAGSIVLSRTRRDAQAITVPDIVVYNSTEYSEKKIGSFAFGGWYLTETTVGTNTVVIASEAFGLTHTLSKIVFTENNEALIPTVQSDSFGETFENGLLLYVEAGMADPFIQKWNVNNSENILTTFTYYYNDTQKLACSYLIEDNKPFAQLTYRDDNGDVITVGNPIYAQITPADIDRFYSNDAVNKDGYVVGGWTDENDVDIDMGSAYDIPCNQILTCVWVPRVYTVYLNVNEDFIPDFGVEVLYSTTKRMYYLNVEYHSSYDWKLTGHDEKTYYLNGWKVNSLTGTKTIPVKGTWSLVLDSDADSGSDIVFTPDWKERKYSMIYICDGVLSNKNVSVSYNEDYTLELPTRDGYTFKGWYYLQENGDMLMLTNENGKCNLPWFLTVSENDTYRIYPKWQANVITVELYLDSADVTPYATVSVTFDSNDYIFALDSSVLTEEQIALFSGWADGEGMIYTDSEGNATKIWDKSATSALYAVWPQAVSTTEQLIEVLTGSMSASIVLTSDLVISNRTFGALDKPYTGVFNGNGHRITYSNNDDNTGFSGLFVRNDGTIKNLDFYVTSIDRNIRTVLYGVDNPVYIGTICGVNNGTIGNVNLEIVDFSVKVNSKNFCFDDVSPAYHVGIVCAQNNGKITGTCVYNYYKDTTYYRDRSDIAASYYSAKEWKLHYPEFYRFVNGNFEIVSAPFNEEMQYYVLTEGSYNNATQEARNYYNAGTWDNHYESFFTASDNEQYENVTVPFDENDVYYQIVDDIFKDQQLFNVGSGTNKMSFTLREHKTNN